MNVELNGLIEGFSGLNGNVVFRTLKDGRVIMAKRPRKYDKTEHQRKTGNRMVQAYRIAEDIIANDPARVAVYEVYAAKKSRSVKQAIAMDILSKPKIPSIKWMVYNGLKPGDLLGIEAFDDHQVVSVNVSILDNGTSLETGEALQQDFSVEYMYELQTAGIPATAEVLVQVTDYAGNVTRKLYQADSIPLFIA
ncbi:hypothetical protein AB9P05_15750 [Roseivirga sp. BDSF3-8]|uniref:hypothetical protein n=1 Tax=Roseivirga sp. BDSF3-8 TaxID=3241598 RepID=UPI003531B12E